MTHLLRLPALTLALLLGLAAPAMYLPSKFKIHFMEPVDLSEYPPETARDPATVQLISEEIRARIQGGLDLILEERESVWTG